MFCDKRCRTDEGAGSWIGGFEVVGDIKAGWAQCFGEHFEIQCPWVEHRADGTEFTLLGWIRRPSRGRQTWTLVTPQSRKLKQLRKARLCRLCSDGPPAPVQEGLTWMSIHQFCDHVTGETSERWEENDGLWQKHATKTGTAAIVGLGVKGVQQRDHRRSYNTEQEARLIPGQDQILVARGGGSVSRNNNGSHFNGWKWDKLFFFV